MIKSNYCKHKHICWCYFSSYFPKQSITIDMTLKRPVVNMHNG